jgi:hypothetical protein
MSIYAVRNAATQVWPVCLTSKALIRQPLILLRLALRPHFPASIAGLQCASGPISPMSEDDAARFRKQAEECREQAAKAFSPLDKEAWLRTAEEWIKLAMSVEERARSTE